MDFQRQNNSIKQLLAGRITRIDTLNKKQHNYVFPRTHYSPKTIIQQSYNSNFRKQSEDSASISSISQVYNLNDQNAVAHQFQPISHSQNSRPIEEAKQTQEELNSVQLCQIRLEPILKSWSQHKNDQKSNGIEGSQNPQKKNKSADKAIKIKLCLVKPHQPNNPKLQLQDLSQQKAEGCFNILRNGVWNLFDSHNTPSSNQRINNNKQPYPFSQRKKQIIKHRKIKSILSHQLSTSQSKHYRSISTNLQQTANSEWATKVQPMRTQSYRSKSALCQKGVSIQKESSRRIKVMEFRY